MQYKSISINRHQGREKAEDLDVNINRQIEILLNEIVKSVKTKKIDETGTCSR